MRNLEIASNFTNNKFEEFFSNLLLFLYKFTCVENFFLNFNIFKIILIYDLINYKLKKQNGIIQFLFKKLYVSFLC